MPQVELSELDVKPGYDIRKFNLFLPFCIHENESDGEIKKNKDKEKIAYFKRAIEVTIAAYTFKGEDESKDEVEEKKPLLNILVADTLDRYNRSEPNTAREDGETWLNIYEPILFKPKSEGGLELVKGRDYKIYRWDDFLIPARSSGYLSRFKDMADEREVTDQFGNMAEKYWKSKVPNYEQLSPDKQNELIATSVDYFMEDYGVTFYIASQYKPTLFFAEKQNKDIRRIFDQCNLFGLNGNDEFAHAHLQIRRNVHFVKTKTSEAVSPMNGNHATMFQSRSDQHEFRKTRHILNKIERLNQLRFEIVRLNAETLQAQLRPIDEQIVKLSEQLSQSNETSRILPRAT